MVKCIIIAIVGTVLMLPVLGESQIKIIRKGGNGKEGPSQNDITEIPELAAIVVFDQGKAIVENVLDKKMRPKEYEAVDLRQGDTIMMLNGKRIKSLEDFKSLYSGAGIGSSIKLGIQRSDGMMIVAFDKADPEKLPKRNIVVRNGDGSDTDDMMILPGTGILIGGKGKKVFVDKIIDDLPASMKDADVKEGDNVTGINGTLVSTFEEFSGAYKKIAVGKKVTIATSRKGKELSFSFTKAEGGHQRVIKREQ